MTHANRRDKSALPPVRSPLSSTRRSSAARSRRRRSRGSRSPEPRVTVQPRPAAGPPAAPGAARTAFDAATTAAAFAGARVKDLRHQELRPGGRASVTLFEAAEDDTRAHPRFRVSVPPAVDPAPPTFSFGAVTVADAAAFSAWLDAALIEAAPRFTHEAPAGAESPRHAALSVSAQRKETFFLAARAVIERLPPAERLAALRALRRAEDATYAGDLRFDDVDTGTYHSFQHDAPFVHYLERLLASLPEEESPAWGLIDANQQQSVRRQREQAQNHLDHLMRHKYAAEGITETDIERTLGGFLIDRETRRIVSETADSQSGLVPGYERLRVDPRAVHPLAGQAVYRSGDRLHTDGDHAVVEVAPELVRATPVEAERLSFRRAPGDPHLRPDVRFDWNGDGYVQPEPIGWVGWAGHCDIKAIMESTGITLSNDPSVTEHRTDTGLTTVYDRDLLTEMVASAFELGSVYDRADGSGTVVRGIHRFGGARNDSHPDRLQFQGTGGPGRSFRWPLGGRQEAFRVVRLRADGQDLDLNTVFYRNIADPHHTDFAPNPRYQKTIEGDYSLLDVAGTLIEADILEDSFDSTSGYPRTAERRISFDLGPNPSEARYYLGTALKDAAAREVYSVTLDRAKSEIEAQVLRYERGAEGWAPRAITEQTVRIPLQRPLTVTLSREMKRDDPALFQEILALPLRKAENICVDTDMKAEVWNGVVTRLQATRLQEDPSRGVERWRLHVTARFGEATLEYLLRRGADGEPVGWAVAQGEEAWGQAPDFFWQDLPDVGSKAFEDGEWVINRTMLERGIVTRRAVPFAQGGVYVEDDHIKNLFEIIWCGLAGRAWTVVHQNKRYAFADEAAWDDAVAELTRLRDAALAELPA